MGHEGEGRENSKEIGYVLSLQENFKICVNEIRDFE
jgi:hypothetical protein